MSYLHPLIASRLRVTHTSPPPRVTLRSSIQKFPFKLVSLLCMHAGAIYARSSEVDVDGTTIFTNNVAEDVGGEDRSRIACSALHRTSTFSSTTFQETSYLRSHGIF